MADERVAAQLVAEGAQKFVKDFTDAANAVAGLQTKLESTDRIRTSQVSSAVDEIRLKIFQLAKDGVKDLDDVIKKFNELSTTVENAGSRVRTPQLRNITQGLQGAIGEVGAQRNRAQLPNIQRTLDPTIQLQQRQLQAVAEAQRKAELAAQAHAATLQGKLQNALASTSRALGAVGATLLNVGNNQKQVEQVTVQATQATNQNAAALINQSSALDTAQKQGITYLSTLSAIHAASFLATGRTFSLIGSFFTLGAAFSRLGPGAIGIGLAFGGLLGIFNALNTASQLLQQVLLGVAQTSVVVTGVVVTATAAAGVAGVKLAADVEQGLALIQAIEGASRQQLGQIAGEAQRLALAFGISVKDIVDASSLFTRAGGNIEDAINGATEAIIKLQVASAGELKAAEAARAIAVGLQAFSKEGRTAIDIANAVTAVAQRSALSFTEVAQAFQQAVPGSITLGITLSDLSAIIVTLGNNALRGTVAGTSFKQFLLDLVNPSDKAAKQLAALDVSIKSADGSIRPIISIIGDLNTALEALTPAGRAEAIAEIFESRAGLAGAILSRQTVTQLQELRAELDALTATQVVDVLLLPLNAQLQRLQVTVSELGRVFGGTLLQPIRGATVAAVSFFQQIIPLAELAGQAVSVILTGQGFGALQQKISEVTDNEALQRFLINIVNSFRNVRDVIVNQIVPAVIDFVNNLNLVANEEGRVADIDDAFKELNRTIQNIGAVTAGAIKALGILVAQIVHNEGKGKELRDTLDNLVKLIVTQLVVGFATMTAGVVIAVKALDLIATAIRQNVLPNVARVANAVALFSALSIAATQPLLAPWIGLAKAILTAKNLIEGADFETALSKAAKEAEQLEGPLADLALKPARAIRDTAITIRDLANEATEANTDVNGFLERSREEARATVKVFEDLTGELPTFLSNLLDEISRAQAQAREDIDKGGAAPNVVDVKEVERAQERILEAGRDISRRLDNLAQDTTTRIGNIVDKALERIGDINEKLQINLDKLRRDTQEKIDDLNDAVTQRRSDRSRLDIERRQQERRLLIIERSLEKQQIFEERQLEEVRILRQRSLEDVQRVYDLQADAAERSFARQRAAAEQAFQAQQKSQQQALEATQSAEEKALQRQLDFESRQRDETQQRAEAKTPEDRKRVEEQIARARSDRAFEQRQQSQLDALQTRHEAQRTQLQQRQEQQQQASRQQQEEAGLQDRLRRDAAALRFRRGLENEERRIRLQEEDAAFERRRNNEIVLDTIKRTQAQEFQKFQDGLEDEATQRQIARIKREQREREGDLTTEAERQRGEVLDNVSQQLAEVNQTIDREVRNALDRLKDIEDSLTPDVAAAVRGVLLGVQQAALSRSKQLIEDTRLQSQQAQSVVGAQLEVTQPTNIPSLVATTLTATNLVLPGGFTQGIANGTFLALQEADRRGFFDTDIPALRELIDVLRAPSPLPTRR